MSANNYLLLVDDKGLQTVENLTPAVYSPALTDEVRRQLDAVSAALTTEDLRNLNSQVDEDRKNPRLVAEEFLKSKVCCDGGSGCLLVDVAGHQGSS